MKVANRVPSPAIGDWRRRSDVLAWNGWVVLIMPYIKCKIPCVDRGISILFANFTPTFTILIEKINTKHKPI